MQRLQACIHGLQLCCKMQSDKLAHLLSLHASPRSTAFCVHIPVTIGSTTAPQIYSERTKVPEMKGFCTANVLSRRMSCIRLLIVLGADLYCLQRFFSIFSVGHGQTETNGK